jgi:hypothetical protein
MKKNNEKKNEGCFVCGKRPEVHSEKRTVREGAADRPPRHELSAILVQTVCELRAPKIH